MSLYPRVAVSSGRNSTASAVPIHCVRQSVLEESAIWVITTSPSTNTCITGPSFTNVQTLVSFWVEGRENSISSEQDWTEKRGNDSKRSDNWNDAVSWGWEGSDNRNDTSSSVITEALVRSWRKFSWKSKLWTLPRTATSQSGSEIHIKYWPNMQ